jgi:hypothetical protein
MCTSAETMKTSDLRRPGTTLDDVIKQFMDVRPPDFRKAPAAPWVGDLFFYKPFDLPCRSRFQLPFGIARDELSCDGLY